MSPSLVIILSEILYKVVKSVSIHNTIIRNSYAFFMVARPRFELEISSL